MWITTHDGRTLNLSAFHELRVTQVADDYVVQVYHCPGTDREFSADLTKPLTQDEAEEACRHIVAGTKKLDFSRGPQDWFAR